MKDKDFETEVLTRLTKIETKLDDYKNVKDKLNDAYSISRQNSKDIEDMRDKLKWITRTIIGAIIAGIIAIIFNYIK